MAQLSRPFPPGTYPVVIIGSGPGGLQLSYCLRRYRIDHAVLSADDAPGGMFRRFPIFQRLITWSKPHAPAARGTRPYEWYDWNSLLADDPAHEALVPEFMDGVSAFPSRPEIAQALEAFAERAGITVRYGCRWEETRRLPEGFALLTTDGEYRCRVAVFAVGMAEPWKPVVPGIELVPHYVEVGPARDYAGKTVFLIGKRNSGFEVADALHPWARQIFLASPRPAVLSLHNHSPSGSVRARYVLPFEDHVLGGGTFVLDAAIDRIERRGDGYRVVAKGTTRPADFTFDVDAAIAATGFTTPVRDLPRLGVKMFAQDTAPALTSFWESVTVPGIYFAGTVTWAAQGLRKYGIASMSGGVAGFRHNMRVLARHLAETVFNVPVVRPTLSPDAVVTFLLAEATRGPELWNQRGYLAHVVSLDRERGIMDEGIVPLQHFVDSTGPDAVAVIVETDATGDHHPAVYVRQAGHVTEHVLGSDTLLDFEGVEHVAQLDALLRPLL